MCISLSITYIELMLYLNLYVYVEQRKFVLLNAVLIYRIICMFSS